MIRMWLSPDVSQYQITPGSGAISTMLAGAGGRYRRSFGGASYLMDLVWILEPADYFYLRAFYWRAAMRGSVPFLLDLRVNVRETETHKAWFIPGSLATDGITGQGYRVSAQVEVVDAVVVE